MSSRKWRLAPSRRERWAGTPLGWTTATVLGALFFSAFTVVSDTSGESVSGGERVGYFADWNTANRDYTIADIAENGAADQLTHLMWAFGDVSSEGKCHIPQGSNQAWEIYQRRYSAEESVDGQADDYRQELAGSLGQLRKLKSEHPALRASISLGGWNWSTYFSRAARTEESRREFVSSCIDLWLRGNLPVRGGEPQGGEGAAAGVFDGIDLDWEWPGGRGHEDNIEHEEDKRNFTLLVREFRRQLDELGSETGEEYALTASVASGEETIADSYEADAFDELDFATVQGYDFSGPWSEVTNHHSQLYAPDNAPNSASAKRAVQQYLDLGVPPEKLVLGFPGFGRGWSGVRADGPARFVRATGAADGGYGGSTESYAALEKREGRRFMDPVNGAYWLIDGDEWWSYDTPEVVAMKGEYVRENGLGGLMLWNLDMDANGELTAAMEEALEGQRPEPSPSVDTRKPSGPSPEREGEQTPDGSPEPG
ncbi:glycoside hydrolase family 18 protein [Haloactinospora alba]|nr:glycoside hydrolase family 18 protein [Haloactinospora alba]